MKGFAGGEFKTPVTNRDRGRLARAQMHFDPAELVIVKCVMFEILDRKLCSQFVFHSRQEIEIKRRRHARCIIISSL